MDIRFENRYKVNELMLREYAYKVVSRNIVLMSVGVFLLGLVVLVVATANQDRLLLGMAGVCMIIAVFAGMLTPQLVLREIHATSDRLNNGKKYETIVRFGEKITMEEGATVMQFEYSQITRIYNLKHSYVLMLGKQNGIILSKTGFMNNDFKEFRQFIQKKTGKKG
ncbi:MAG: YcxB family protein [Clostridiales bacterium]|nr:YcxB family protein [Clostridiales bacterium]MCD7887417.1 YcxB family protein [Clostridiales bacterium]